jgi:hypothetical protein
MVHSIKQKVLYLSLILSAHFVGRSFQKVNNSILNLFEYTDDERYDSNKNTDD